MRKAKSSRVASVVLESLKCSEGVEPVSYALSPSLPLNLTHLYLFMLIAKS